MQTIETVRKNTLLQEPGEIITNNTTLLNKRVFNYTTQQESFQLQVDLYLLQAIL